MDYLSSESIREKGEREREREKVDGCEWVRMAHVRPVREVRWGDGRRAGQRWCEWWRGWWFGYGGFP